MYDIIDSYIAVDNQKSRMSYKFDVDYDSYWVPSDVNTVGQHTHANPSRSEL